MRSVTKLQAPSLVTRSLQRFAPVGSFKRNVLTMMTGSTLAQGLIVASAPLLTRLYTPEDFGIYGLFTAISSVIGVIITGRYELAIMLPKEDEDAANLAALALLITIGMTGLSLLGVVFLRRPISELLEAPELARWLWALPIGLLASGFYSTFTVWWSRRKEFRRIAISRARRSGTTATVQLAAGMLSSTGPWGLVVGDVVGVIVAAGTLALPGSAEDRKPWRQIKKDKILALLFRHKKFAIFSAPAGLFNQGTHYFPFIILGYFFGPIIVGYFLLAQRVLGLPLSIIGDSIGYVFYEKLSKEKMGEGEPYMLLVKAFSALMITGTIGGVLLFALSTLFSTIFGANWSEAGYFVQLLLPMFLIRLGVSPISQTLIVYEKQELGMYWQLCLMLGATGSVAAGGLLGSASISILSYSLFAAFMYLLHFSISLRCAGGKLTRLPYYTIKAWSS